jgi:large subunit ribosomal protein L44
VATQAPLFNIGLFLSNGLKLAEGHGSTLLMAEHRAAHNALLSLFLVQETSKRTLPTAVHTERPAAAAPAPEEKSFVPNTAAAGRESLLGLGPAMRQAL